MSARTHTGHDGLPEVRLDVRLPGGRSVPYSLDHVDFLVGTVPGCDLRVPGSELPAILCLLARRPSGLSVRKLNATQPLQINGQATSAAEVRDGDRINIAGAEITVHVAHAAPAWVGQGPHRAPPNPELEQTKNELQQKILHLRAELERFETEKTAFQKENDALQQQRESLLRERESFRKERDSFQKSCEDWDAHSHASERDWTGRVTQLDAREAALVRRQSELDKLADTLRKDRERLESERLGVLNHQTEKSSWEQSQVQQQAELQRRETQLLQREDALLRDRQALERERGEVQREQQESARLRQELVELRKQSLEHYQQRNERVTLLQEENEKSAQLWRDRTADLQAKEAELADRLARQTELERSFEERAKQIQTLARKVEDERKVIEQRQAQQLEDLERKETDLRTREEVWATQNADLEQRQRLYQADVLRLDRLQADFERRESERLAKEAELASRLQQLQADSDDFQHQVSEMEAWRVRLGDEAQTLSRQKKEQDTWRLELQKRAEELESQQTTFASLRTRLERMRDEIRVQEQQLETQRLEQETVSADLDRQRAEMAELRQEIDRRRSDFEHERLHWSERSAVMETAVRQLRQTQDQLATDDSRLKTLSTELDQRTAKLAEQEALLRSQFDQLADTQQRLELDRQSLRERSLAVLQSEQAREALQEQLHKRSEDLADRQRALQAQFDAHSAKVAEFESERAKRDEEHRLAVESMQQLRLDLEAKAEKLELQQTELAEFDGKYQEHLKSIDEQRRVLNEERSRWVLEHQDSQTKHAQARGEFDTLKKEAVALLQQMPEMELRMGTSLDRLTDARDQLRDHLNEIHQYVRHSHEDLETLRVRLQEDLEKHRAQEQSLHRQQDEHRLAMVAFRQNLIEWQAQVAEMRRLLVQDETRLERRHADVEAQQREVEAATKDLERQVEVLEEQQNEVVQRRQELDHHLVDMQQWYRKKLRELAGVPLLPVVPASESVTATPPSPPEPAPTVDGDEAIVPIQRDILSMAGPMDAGDRKLGAVLEELQLVEGDALMALLVEARRQRRSLRQVLLSSGVLTLYQLSLIEAGNLTGLMLGPVRVIDRVRSTLHETFYRVFDPRRGTEALLRHLAEADMHDAVRPDEYRQRFQQATLNDLNLVNTLEVLEIGGRPAVLQEWITGLPATDWPPLAAAPGVCYRLLTQAAQGLHAAHQAGTVHGHLRESSLLLQNDGHLKIAGLGEPPWLAGNIPEEEPTLHDDLRTLGNIVSGWCTPSGVRKGAKSKPLPDALVSILFRLAAEGEAAYADTQALLDDLRQSADQIPANSEAWDRLVKYVRDHGTPEVLCRQSA